MRAPLLPVGVLGLPEGDTMQLRSADGEEAWQTQCNDCDHRTDRFPTVGEALSALVEHRKGAHP